MTIESKALIVVTVGKNHVILRFVLAYSLVFSIMFDLVSVGGSASGTLAGAGKRTSSLLHSKENHDSIKVEGISCSSIISQKIVMLTVCAPLLYPLFRIQISMYYS